MPINVKINIFWLRNLLISYVSDFDSYRVDIFLIFDLFKYIIG